MKKNKHQRAGRVAVEKKRNLISATLRTKNGSKEKKPKKEKQDQSKAETEDPECSTQKKSVEPVSKHEAT